MADFFLYRKGERMKRRQILESMALFSVAATASKGMGRQPFTSLNRSDPVLAYIENHFDSTIYRDAPGAGFRGVDLPYPYTSPCIREEGKYYFFFYWDTYWTNKGLLASGRAETAKHNILNMLWLIRRQGYMPNHVGIYNRSQPPYLNRMVRDYVAATGDRSILPEAAQGLLVEYNFWMTARRNGTGLNQYGSHDTDEGHAVTGRKARITAIAPIEGKTAEQICYSGFTHTAEAESGCDYTPRFEGRCPDFAAVDLNTLLYELELDLAGYQQELGWDYHLDFTKRAQTRKELIHKLLWDDERGWFFDYDSVNRRPGNVPALTGLLPLVAGIATPQQAARAAENIKWFERDYGLGFTPELPGCRRYQWSFPNVWPPMAWVAVEAMRKYGFENNAKRLASKYVETARRLFAKTGQLWEKTDAETGDVAGGEYDAAAMLGWTAGVYIELESYLRQ
jgi:alpha,alpha-trehalase